MVYCIALVILGVIALWLKSEDKKEGERRKREEQMRKDMGGYDGILPSEDEINEFIKKNGPK